MRSGESGLARLAFWAANMCAIKEAGMSWPGFSYDEAEWKRFAQLAKEINGAAFVRFLMINAVAFIVFAGFAVVAVFLPLLMALYPDITKIEPLPFVLLLALTALLAIGLGLPLSMRIAAVLAGGADVRSRLEPMPGDSALAAKVSRQLIRMTVIMCGLLIPGVLLWIAYDLQSGPVMTLVKWTAAALMLGSAGYIAVRRGR
jgi:hypothetical protein